MLVPGGYDFVDVRDLCLGVVAALARGRTGEKYLLSGHFPDDPGAGGADRCGERTPGPQTVMPAWLLRGLVPVFRGVAWASGAPPLLTEESLRALTDSNPVISSAKAERELGYSKRPAAETVADTIAWFRQAGRLT